MSTRYIFTVSLVLLTITTWSCRRMAEESNVPVLEEMVPPPASATDTSMAESMPLTDTAVVTQRVKVVTSMGTFVIGLYGLDAPLTVKNFVGLVKKKFYDGILVHRVSRDYLVQMGDPFTKDPSLRSAWGRGGTTATGEPLPAELDATTPSAMAGYDVGVVAMARRIDNDQSGSSQFFICLEKAKVVKHDFTIFGKIIDGIDVVMRMNEVAVEPSPLDDNDGIPVSPIEIRKVTLLQQR